MGRLLLFILLFLALGFPLAGLIVFLVFAFYRSPGHAESRFFLAFAAAAFARVGVFFPGAVIRFLKDFLGVLGKRLRTQ